MKGKRGDGKKTHVNLACFHFFYSLANLAELFSPPSQSGKIPCRYSTKFFTTGGERVGKDDGVVQGTRKSTAIGMRNYCPR